MQIFDTTERVCGLYHGPWSVCLGETLGDKHYVAKIVPYREAGEMGYVPWFDVYNEEGQFIMKVNASHITLVKYG